MITRLVLFGATGDLAGRFLLPALARLRAAGRLPDGLQVVGAAQQDWDDQAFARHAAARLEEHAGEVSPEVRQALLGNLRYRRVNFDDPATVVRAVRAFPNGATGAGAAVAAYLALPPGLFPAAIRALGGAALPPGSRIVVEKPFGDDLDSAVALNAQLAEVTGQADEGAVFRVDHVLGMPTVQDLLELPWADPAVAPVWNGTCIEQVDVLWEETLALEGRADFYDRTGAVKDVMQNHVLQLLALVAMEPPATPAEQDLRDAKVGVLRSVRPMAAGDIAARTRRARYMAGRLADGSGASAAVVPDYAREDGVDPDRGTETYAELVLELDRDRWAGTRFVLRAGKALAKGRKGVLVHFRPGVPLPDALRAGLGSTNQLWIGLDDPHDISPPLPGRAVGPPPPSAPSTTSAQPADGQRPAYGQVLLDVLTGGSLRSVRGDEAEESWRVVEPVLRAWADGAVPLLEYAAGSAGPPVLDDTRHPD